MATVKTNVIKIDTQPAAKSVKELRQELKELRDQLLSVEQGTVEYGKIMQQAADIQHTLREQTEELNASAMDFGQITSNMTKTATGMVGAFQTVNALMGMFGVESESAQKAILKLQQSMAIIQGLQAMDNGVKAFKRLGLAIKNSTIVTELFTTATKAKTVATNADTVATTGATIATNAFKAALISTGIGAIAVAIGVLIANWDKLTDSIGGSTAKLRDWNSEMDSLSYNIDYQQKLLAAQGADNLTLLQSELAGLQKEKDLLDKEFNTLQGKKNMRIKLNKEQEERYNELIDLRSKKLDEITIQEAKIATEEKKIQDKLVEQQAKNEEAKTKKAKEEAEKRKKAYQDEADAAAKAYAALVDKYRDTVEKLQIEMDKELVIAGDNEALRLQIIESYGDKIYAAREKELKDIRKDAYDADLKNLKDLYNKKELSSAEYYDKLRKLDAEYMVDWGSYQAAAIARYNEQLIDIRQQFLNWQISYGEYTVKIDEEQRKHYNELLNSNREFVETKKKEIEALNMYKSFVLTGDTSVVAKDRLGEYKEMVEKVLVTAKQQFPNLFKETKNTIDKITVSTINKMIESAESSQNAAQAAIYNIQDYFIKAREAAFNWIDALNSIEVRTYADRKERIQNEYEDDLEMLKTFLEDKIILEEGYNEAVALLDKRRATESAQLIWDMYSEQISIINEVGAATTAIGDAITANAELQLEAGKISQEQYQESLKQAQAYNIAGVVISTLAGIANATASIWSPNNAYLTVWGQAGMQAAITTEMVASMIAQIAQIKKQTLNSTGYSGSVSSSAVGSLNAPLQYTATVEGASVGRNTKDTRVYVTEHDISSTINRVSVAQSEARF